MKCIRVPDTSAYAEPQAAGWQGVAAATARLVPAPLEMQPNNFIVANWQGRSYGLTAAIEARAVHDGRRIAIRLAWAKERPDTGGREGFPDGVAVAFPVAGEPALWTMGNDDEPVEFVQWRALKGEVRSVLAWGIGSSVPGGSPGATAKAGWSQGRWTVVLGRDMMPAGTAAQLRPGTTAQIGFAVWNGSNEERAGIKAVAEDWTGLDIEA